MEGEKRHATVAFCVALGGEAQAQAEECRKTFRHFHPDIPFFIIDDAAYRLLAQQDRPSWTGEIIAVRSLAGWFLSLCYPRVISLDADLFVLGPLDDLIAFPQEVALTHDYSTYEMNAPELPIINSGVLAAQGSAFWHAWSWAQFAYVLPYVNEFMTFDQLTLRLLAASGKCDCRLLPEYERKRFYNVAIRQQPGEWREEPESGRIFKGESLALIYHQAGEAERGVGALPLPVRHRVRSILKEELSDIVSDGPDIEVLWNEKKALYLSLVEMLFRNLPLQKLEGFYDKLYRDYPGIYQTAAPLYWERKRFFAASGFTRFLDPKTNALLYRDA